MLRGRHGPIEGPSSVDLAENSPLLRQHLQTSCRQLGEECPSHRTCPETGSTGKRLSIALKIVASKIGWSSLGQGWPIPLFSLPIPSKVVVPSPREASTKRSASEKLRWDYHPGRNYGKVR